MDGEAETGGELKEYNYKINKTGVVEATDSESALRQIMKEYTDSSGLNQVEIKDDLGNNVASYEAGSGGYYLYVVYIPGAFMSIPSTKIVKAQNPEEALEKGYDLYKASGSREIRIIDPSTREVLLSSRVKDLPNYQPPEVVGSDNPSDTSYATKAYDSLKNLLNGARKKI
ncbi:MAG: hypothetical protein KAT28_00395 [Candidatus Aenigmarchaeota archaeon]|nr:hypothetical protein [Candidatus Aenigmarchaeota archaeon]